MTAPYHIDPRNKDERTEQAIQLAFRNKMRMRAPQVMLVGIPNAGRRTEWERRQRSAEGMVPGFPDMIALFDGRTLGLEFKSGIGSLSSQQKETLNRLVQQRIPVGVFRSETSAIDWVEGHFPHAFAERAA